MRIHNQSQLLAFVSLPNLSQNIPNENVNSSLGIDCSGVSLLNLSKH